VTRTTHLDPTELDGGKKFLFLAQLYLPAGMYRSITMRDNTPVTELRAPDGSWCHIARQPDTTGHHTVWEAGPTPLTECLERAWMCWQNLGSPDWHQFGLTATTTHQHIWHQNPHNGPRWQLPLPRIPTPRQP
jgi:hypothetical protein